MPFIVYSETTRIIDSAFETAAAAQAHVDAHEEELVVDTTNRVLPDQFQAGVWHFHADGTLAPDPPAATIQLAVRRDRLLNRCRYWLRIPGMAFIAAAEGNKEQAYGLHLEGCVRAVMVDGNLSDDAKHTEIKTELDLDPKAWVALANAASWVGARGSDRSGWNWQNTDAGDGTIAVAVAAITINSDINWIGALI